MIREQTIFLIEDNDDDAELAVLAFQRAKLTNPIVRARDGVEALDYLWGRGAHEERDVSRLPAVTLLDLKLPGLNGLDVLKAIRCDVRTKHLPVVILTSSNEEKDRFGAYDLFANSYVLKPVDFDQFVAVAFQLCAYWTSLNEPNGKKGARDDQSKDFSSATPTLRAEAATPRTGPPDWHKGLLV
jgi:two-component system response regulator